MTAAMEAITTAFGWRDALALAVFQICLFGLTWAIERPQARRLSVGRLMARRRVDWMARLAEREMRIADATLLAMLHQGSAFYASACMIAIGGIAALIGNADPLVSVAQDLAVSAPGPAADRRAYELKLLFLLGMMALAFHRFVWAHRLYSYCAILMGATPEREDAEAARAGADAAARVNIRAGRSFNRGLRLVYFSLAALAWLLGPEAFLLATLLTAAVIWRREYGSETRDALDQ